MMKNYLFLGLLVIVIAVACQETHYDLECNHTSVVDKTERWEIDLNYPQFSAKSEEMNRSCDIVNQKIEEIAMKWQDSIKIMANNFFDGDWPDMTERPTWSYHLFVRDSVFMATSEYISVRLTTYLFMGGAHGITQFESINYDLKGEKFFSKEQIFDMQKEAEIDIKLKEHFNNPNDCFSELPTLELVNAINFTPIDITLTYEQYVLGAYACGYYESKIPRADLKELILIP